MANFTGANIITATDVTKYQPDAFQFGISTTATETVNFFAQTTNDILRQLRVEWWPVYKTNIYTDITVLNTAEMVNTRVQLDQFERAGVYLFLGRFFCPALSKFRPETEKDRFERMSEKYMSEFKKISKAVKFAVDLGIEVHAGHGLTYESAKIISNIKKIKEFNIGHFLVGEAMYVGLPTVIKKFKKIIG